VIYKTRTTSLIHKLIALNYHRRILFTEIFSYSHNERYQADTSDLRELLDKTYRDVMSGIID
ncbi:MAG: hypothetical protein KH748_09050, partial [Firmicutes bacterium]|nr:hypothetical protein [Bacillota bacterium]